MKQVRKHLLVASLIATFGLAAAAQTPATPPGPPQGGPMMGRMAQGDPAKMQTQRTERHAARMAALKAKLKLTPDQESAWTTFAASMQPRQAMTGNPAQFRAEMEKLTTPERIDKMQALKAQRHAEMTQHGDATKTFYAALTPEQKKVFDAETLRMGATGKGGGRQGGMGYGHGMGYGAGIGYGPGMGQGQGMGYGPGMGMGPARN
jgi:Spy/CpxP family protein refolding chaperone